jgi:hypothetical protein
MDDALRQACAGVWDTSGPIIPPFQLRVRLLHRRGCARAARRRAEKGAAGGDAHGLCVRRRIHSGAAWRCSALCMAVGREAAACCCVPLQCKTV